MLRFNRTYFMVTIGLLLVEIVIGAYLHDSIIRPYGGDFLVVILIYCFVRSFLAAPVNTTALCVLLFAYVVEVSQYYKLAAIMGLKHSKLANIILGNSFSWIDMLTYTLGIATVIGLEKSASTKRLKKRSHQHIILKTPV